MRWKRLSAVMPVPGLDPGIVAGIHAFPLPSLPRMRGREASKQAWMAGTSQDKPGHDSGEAVQYDRHAFLDADCEWR